MRTRNEIVKPIVLVSQINQSFRAALEKLVYHPPTHPALVTTQSGAVPLAAVQLESTFGTHLFMLVLESDKNGGVLAEWGFDTLAPYLFVLVLDYVMRKSMDTTLGFVLNEEKRIISRRTIPSLVFD